MGSSTDIFLVRHGVAIDGNAGLGDEHRYLTAKGRKIFTQLAEELRSEGIRFDLIVASPLVRTVQTAEILAAFTKYKGDVVAATAFAPGGRAMEYLLRTAAAHEGEKIAFVGHEPRMGQLAGQLLDRPPLPFKKGQIMRIDFESRVEPGVAGKFRWALLPSGDRIGSMKDLDES